MQFMYEQVGLAPPTKTQKLSAFEVLRVAATYWKRCFGPQDTLLICLEVQQMWMYYYFKKKLQKLIEYTKKHVTRDDWKKEAKD